MSRHRDIRNMDYSDEYDGYDDVYGHSVDDDFYISPSNGQFLYNRENSTRSSESDIKEEDEVEAQLSDIDKAKLESCLSHINATLGPTTIPRSDLVNIIVNHKFNVEEALNTILERPQSQQAEKEKDVTNQQKKFVVPKLNGLRSIGSNDDVNIKGFSVPKISNFGKNLPPKTNNFFIPKLHAPVQGDRPTFTVPNIKLPKENVDDNCCDFASLSELVSSHLNTTPVKQQTCLIKNKINSIDEASDPPGISKMTNDLANLQVSDVKSLSSIENKNGLLTDWHIDLTAALKTAKSLPSISSSKHQTKLETFDIPFVDCEEQILPKTRQLLTCKFDISDILLMPVSNKKCKSRFARVLCRTYRRPRPVILTSDTFNLSKLKRFNFNIPSPDDIISSHFKR